MITVIRKTCDRDHPGLWDYHVPGLGLSGRSRQPLLAACRQIKAMLGATGEQAALFREGHSEWDIRCPVEVGAALSVEERDRASLRFGPYRAFSALKQAAQ